MACTVSINTYELETTGHAPTKYSSLVFLYFYGAVILVLYIIMSAWSHIILRLHYILHWYTYTYAHHNY